MISTGELYATFGDVIELDFPIWDLNTTSTALSQSPEWKNYNPRKPNNRFGLSVTSLDGGYSGVPDLDSLLEFNKINGTEYKEEQFSQRTPIVDSIPELPILLDTFKPMGRCHFLRMDAGGFFPPHRDNGSKLPSPSFRIIVPLMNTNPRQWKWIQENNPVHLETGRTYCINTSKEHSVFSFVDNCVLFVMNIPATYANCMQVASHLHIK